MTLCLGHMNESFHTMPICKNCTLFVHGTDKLYGMIHQ